MNYNIYISWIRYGSLGVSVSRPCNKLEEDAMKKIVNIIQASLKSDEKLSSVQISVTGINKE